MLEGFCREHVFADGNKRTALLATYSFLQANGHYMVIPLDAVRFLVCVARHQAETEDEIDALIDEIACWLERRTATSKKEFNRLVKKHVRNPLIKLFLISITGIGLFYAVHLINKWFVTDMHPEYKHNLGNTMAFLLDTINDSRLAAERLEET